MKLFWVNLVGFGETIVSICLNIIGQLTFSCNMTMRRTIRDVQIFHVILTWLEFPFACTEMNKMPEDLLASSLICQHNMTMWVMVFWFVGGNSFSTCKFDNCLMRCVACYNLEIWTLYWQINQVKVQHLLYLNTHIEKGKPELHCQR